MARFRDFDLFRGQITPARLLQQTRVHKGDMTQKHFGFSQQDFFMLGSRVHTIYSLGVSVSLLKTYSDLRDIDVGRMKDLVELAAMGTKPSAIVHLSTFSVPQIQSWHQVQRHDRHRVIKTPVSARSYVPSTDDDNGYAKVRWVGERVLEEAASRGFPVTILRGSAMTRSIATGVPEPRCGIVQQGIMGMLLSGTVPDVPGYVADFVPIDHLAKWIYALAEQPHATTITEARFYHVTNPSPLPIVDIRGIDSGTTKTIPLKEWFELMEQSTAHGSGDLVRWAGIRAFFETGHVYWGLETASTERVMARLGINMRECPPVTMDFLTELWGDWPSRDA
ncbi:hypothetical protein PWT90_08812 [Aphanocladium album]|nr:hypothetical protein PWT90_08812 [Aphanocladium album]